MRKFNQRTVGSDIYARIAEVQMNDADRRAAVDALRHAEAIADGLLWIKERVAALGNYFLRPSLKH